MRRYVAECRLNHFGLLVQNRVGVGTPWSLQAEPRLCVAFLFGRLCNLYGFLRPFSTLVMRTSPRMVSSPQGSEHPLTHMTVETSTSGSWRPE